MCYYRCSSRYVLSNTLIETIKLRKGLKMKLKTNRKLNSVEKQMIQELISNGESLEQISNVMQLDMDIILAEVDKKTLPDNTVSEVANVNSEEEELTQKLQSLQTQIDEAQQTLQDLQSSVDIEKTLLDNITAETNQHYKTLQSLENHLGALGFRDISQLQKLLAKLDSKEFQMNKDLLIEKPSVCLLNKIIKTKLPQYVFNEESCKNFKLKNGMHAGKKLSVVYSTEYSYFEHIFKQNLITVLVMLNLMYTYKTDLSRLSFSPVDNNR